jgi:hypothetical protein
MYIPRARLIGERGLDGVRDDLRFFKVNKERVRVLKVRRGAREGVELRRETRKVKRVY